MLIAHLSDLHLGYRAYNRLAVGGVNVRERDVARAFRNAIDAVIALEPQLIVIAGDIFHTVRPSNSAIADAFHHFARLSAKLSDTQIVLVGGDHDTPRSVESGSILRLFKEIPRVSVVDQGAREIEFSQLGVAVLGVSHSGLLENPLLKPSSDAETNVLVMHGSYDQEVLRTFHDYSGAYFDLSDLNAQSWDYIALGHYHEFAELRPNAFYSGALEHT
ncbi:MAG TPA: metallophosphoesterase, partial [Longimicrobiales bacterium]|nr:metallophosphoesterase [Longimicrobiales bacterium]